MRSPSFSVLKDALREGRATRNRWRVDRSVDTAEFVFYGPRGLCRRVPENRLLFDDPYDAIRDATREGVADPRDWAAYEQAVAL